jgi:CreA protein
MLIVDPGKWEEQRVGKNNWKRDNHGKAENPNLLSYGDYPCGGALQWSKMSLRSERKVRLKTVLKLMLIPFSIGIAHAEEIGSVDTAFKLFGPDHKVVVEAFDDPSVNGVACYVSRAKTGGIKGALGIAKDPSRFSVACRQVGPIHFVNALPHQEEVFRESASLVFKHVRVVRIVDSKRNALTYLTYSDKFIEGSPDNAITAVAVFDQKIPIK